MASYQPRISDFLAKPRQARSHNVGYDVTNIVILIDSSEESDTHARTGCGATQEKITCSSISIDNVSRRDVAEKAKSPRRAVRIASCQCDRLVLLITQIWKRTLLLIIPMHKAIL